MKNINQVFVVEEGVQSMADSEKPVALRRMQLAGAKVVSVEEAPQFIGAANSGEIG